MPADAEKRPVCALPAWPNTGLCPGGKAEKEQHRVPAGAPQGGLGAAVKQ